MDAGVVPRRLTGEREPDSQETLAEILVVDFKVILLPLSVAPLAADVPAALRCQDRRVRPSSQRFCHCRIGTSASRKYEWSYRSVAFPCNRAYRWPWSCSDSPPYRSLQPLLLFECSNPEIGRASCRERVVSWV